MTFDPPFDFSQFYPFFFEKKSDKLIEIVQYLPSSIKKYQHPVFKEVKEKLNVLKHNTLSAHVWYRHSQKQSAKDCNSFSFPNGNICGQPDPLSGP
jgi:hypothetical protein